MENGVLKAKIVKKIVFIRKNKQKIKIVPASFYFVNIEFNKLFYNIKTKRMINKILLKSNKKGIIKIDFKPYFMNKKNQKNLKLKLKLLKTNKVISQIIIKRKRIIQIILPEKRK